MESPLPESHARSRLVAAATELFTTRGYAATSVREIVEKAGVTKPVLYYYFQSKEGLYLEIMQEIETLLKSALDRMAATGGTARERIELLCLGLFDLFELHKDSVRLMNSVFWGPPQGAPPFDLEAIHRLLHATLEVIVGKGIEVGEIRSMEPKDAVLAVTSLLSFSIDLDLAHPHLSPGREGLGRMLKLLFDGVFTSPSSIKESAT